MKTSPLLPMLLQLATLQRLVLAQPVSAAAAAAAATTFGFGRFTVVSDSLIRLELGTDAAGVALWDDRPTLSYPGGRPSAQAAHTVAHPSADVLTIATSQLLLRYDRSASPGGAFTNASLSITLTAADAGGSGATVWRPGLQNPGNLRGTRLDIGCYATFESCYSNGLSPGPLSTSGWSVMDDTVRGSAALRPTSPLRSICLKSKMYVLVCVQVGVRMETEDDPEVGFPWYSDIHPCDPEIGVCGPTQTDWYFFGHGHRYRDALQDFSAVSGKASLPPRSAFGVWWSTWYNFTSYELTHTVLDGYAKHGLPLDVSTTSCCCPQNMIPRGALVEPFSSDQRTTNSICLLACLSAYGAVVLAKLGRCHGHGVAHG
jgi:hypothetical protein